MAALKVLSKDTDSDHKRLHQASFPVLHTTNLDILDGDCEVAAVRLPIADERRPLGQGTKGLTVDKPTTNPDRPSFTSHSNSPTSSLPVTKLHSTTSTHSNIRVPISSTSCSVHSNGRTSITLHQPFNTTERSAESTHHSLRGERKLLESSFDAKTAGSRSSPKDSELSILTFCQSRPASNFEATANSSDRVIIKFPDKHSQMSSSSKPVGDPHHHRHIGEPSRASPRPAFASPYTAHQNNINNRFNPSHWTTWQELSVKLTNIPTSTTTRDLYKAFSREGTIISIEIYENTRGQRDGKASIRFSPAPKNPFWQHGHFAIPIAAEGITKVQVSLEPQKRTFKHPSPSDKEKTYPEVMIMKASSLHFGMILDPTTMMSMCTVMPSLTNDIQFRLNMLHREITVEFVLDIRDPRSSRKNTDPPPPHLGKENRRDRFRFRIPFSQLEVIHRIETRGDNIELLIRLETPPKYFKKLNPEQTHVDDAKYWGESDSWYRQTDIIYAPTSLRKTTLSLKKTRPVIDLGRWTCYRLVFGGSKNPASPYGMIRQALQDYNIAILPFGPLHIPKRLNAPVWAFLDKANLNQTEDTTDLLGLGGEDIPPLAFQVRYQLEVCISNGYLNEHTLSRAFVSRLGSMDAGKARDLLEYVANQGKQVFDPMSLFSLKIVDGTSLRVKIPHYCVYIRSATITPTSLYLQTPVPETSNRVIRQYIQHADRFLRVKFTEEKTEGAIYATDKDNMNEVFTRVKRVLQNGIHIGDRKYEFLACGNSQFREHGSYFFAPLPNLPTEKIRNWMGMFTEIKTVPLYLARLGQCFSTTRAIQSAKTKLLELEDIKRNGYNFSDGVGRISPHLARLAASELGILGDLEQPPSLFQIRAGGCKGVVAVWPMTGPSEVFIRRSQYKFPATHDGLEIIRWSQYACANLNRQLILILSALGVPDNVFKQKLKLQLSSIERAMTHEETALAILQKDIDNNQMTLVVASMILDGFQKAGEPFLMSLLQLWRAWSIKYLKEKARITIGKGALLLGCVDETGILEGHYNDTPSIPIDAPIDVKSNYVPDVFVQVSRNVEGKPGKPQVITGPMLLARNPSLHPGDVRIVCGIDVPELHHLVDVVVLPQTGDRDIASMCSGGDLDGDDFLVIWDEDLLPREWNLEPMDYTRPPMIKHGKNIGIDDLTTFFVTYMKNDTLARIAQAHLANADYLENGVKDQKCLKLAELHSMAVDYVKTGHPAQMSRDLNAPKRPHFMDTTYTPKDRVYISRKVLGQLYDQVERVDFVPLYMGSFDDRILSAYAVDEAHLASAKEIKVGYDAHVRRIMAQHEIKTEFEVWSTFVLEHSRTTNDFKFHEQIGQISVSLKAQFRDVCIERAGGKMFQQLGPFVAAMYKTTADEMSQAVRECQQTQTIGGQNKPARRMTPANMPLMSFPWLFPDVLGKIAKYGKQQPAGANNEDIPNARGPLRSTHTHKTRGQTVKLDELIDLETADGNNIRMGDLLGLFEDSNING